MVIIFVRVLLNLVINKIHPTSRNGALLDANVEVL